MALIRTVIRRAALEAAQSVLEQLPAGLVRWDDEQAVQGEPGWPTVLLLPGAQVPVTYTPEVKRELVGGEVERSLTQIYDLTVTVQVESWMADARGVNDPMEFVRRMREAWLLSTVQAALCDDETPAGLTDLRQILTFSRGVGGHMLPIFAYEIVVRYASTIVDPVRIGIIDRMVITGEVESGDDTVESTIDIERP